MNSVHMYECKKEFLQRGLLLNVIFYTKVVIDLISPLTLYIEKYLISPKI